MLPAQENKKSLNFITYKLKSSLKIKLNNNQNSKRNYTMDPEQTNPVYIHLRRQRVNRHILQFILGGNSHKPDKKSLNRSQSYSPNFEVFEKNSGNILSRQMRKFRSQGEYILNNVHKISQEMKQSKRRISILDQYNNLMGKYCEVVPKLKTNNDKEIYKAHKEIQKLCTEQILSKQTKKIGKTQQFRHFQEPKVNLKMLKRSKRIATTQVSQPVPFEEEIFKRNNTYSF